MRGCREARGGRGPRGGGGRRERHQRPPAPAPADTRRRGPRHCNLMAQCDDIIKLPRHGALCYRNCHTEPRNLHLGPRNLLRVRRNLRQSRLRNLSLARRNLRHRRPGRRNLRVGLHLGPHGLQTKITLIRYLGTQSFRYCYISVSSAIFLPRHEMTDCLINCCRFFTRVTCFCVTEGVCD